MPPFESYAPYYYLSALAIFVAFPLLKKKKEITPWKYRELLYLFIFLVFILCINFYFGRRDIKNPLWYLSWNIFFFQFIYFVPLLYIFFVVAKSKLRNVYFVVHNKEDILWGIGVGIIIGVIGFLKIFTSKDAILGSCDSYIVGEIPTFYIILPMVSVFGPLTEELIFRGILIPTFEERMNTVSALILSNIFFVLMHGFFYGAIIIFFLGLILGLFFIKRRTIVPGFIVHSMLNTAYFIAIQLVLLRKI